MAGIASRTELRMSFLRYALFTVPAMLLIGTLSSGLAGAGAGNGWFDALVKPPTIPPDWVLQLGWPIAYVLIGLSLAMVLHARGARRRGRVLALFAVQLAGLCAWAPLFFAWHRPNLALEAIAAMAVVTGGLILAIWRIRPVAGLLLYPCLAWLMFVGMLNYQIVALNPDAETLVPGTRTIDIETNTL